MENQMLGMMFGMAKAQFKKVTIKSLDVELIERNGKTSKFNNEIIKVLIEGNAQLKGFVEVE